MTKPKFKQRKPLKTLKKKYYDQAKIEYRKPKPFYKKKNTTTKPKFEERKPKPFQVIKKITMTKPKFEQRKPNETLL